MWRYVRLGGLALLVIVGLGATLWALGMWRSVIEIESQQEARVSDKQQAKRLLHLALEQRKVLGPDGRFAVAFYNCDLYRFDEPEQQWLPIKLEFGADQEATAKLSCRSAEVQLAGEYLMASICQQVVGSSGGCFRFGLFRSDNGRIWQRRREGPKGEFWLPASSL
jgi:hypothetical protein